MKLLYIILEFTTRCVYILMSRSLIQYFHVWIRHVTCVPTRSMLIMSDLELRM